MSYLIKKNSKNNTITYMDYDLKGYKFTPKSKKHSTIKVNQIMVVNPKMIDKILTIKFNDMFKKLMNFATLYLYDTSGDESAAVFALGEIDRIKSIIANKYKNYISQKKQAFFLDKLNYLEKQIKMKAMINYSYMNSFNEQMNNGRGR